MKAIRLEKTQTFLVTALPFAAICLLLLIGGFVGAGVASVGGGSGSKALLIGGAAFVAIAAFVCFVLELPVISFVRFAFILSFFFKGELNLYKIDEIEDPSGFNLSLTLLTGLILLIYDQFDFQDDFREKLFPTAFSILLVALLICAVASVIYGGASLLGWFSIWSFLTSVLIAAVIASHFSVRERLIQLVTGIGVGLLFTGAVALSQYVVEFPMNLSFFGTGTEEELLGTQSIAMSRVPAFLRTPTEMAWVVSTLVPIVLGPLICRAKDFDSRHKIVLFASAFAGIVAVILSLARGSWISLLVALAILVLLGWQRLSVNEKRRYFVSVFGVIVFATLLLAPFGSKIYDRLTEDDQGSALIRVPLMETAIRMIEDNPFVGVGLNSYRANMTRYDETEIFVSQVFPNPVHNVFAHVTAEIGVPGGIVFCLLILVALIECFKTMTARDRLLFALALGATAGMIAFVISAIKEPGSLGSVRPPVRTCFFMFGVILATSRLRRQLAF